MKALGLRAHEKGLELTCDSPARRSRTGCVGDPGRLRQILINLVGNAIKFTEQGEVVRTASAMDAGDRRFEFALISRSAIRESEFQRTSRRSIFEAFTQADGSTTRKFGGTGLGWPSARVWWR